ncbi:MAG: lysylphosphatidylglycerol synthase transmembrane domain-containing protein [Gammaproteobacteria bacterium]
MAGLRHVLIGIGGLAIGGVLLWLSLRAFEPAVFSAMLAGLDARGLLLAGAAYWSGLWVRAVRWGVLIGRLQTVAGPAVLETLLVGYGANNLLPARLGELVRADYGKRVLGVSRSRLLGTIVLERVLDLTAVLGCLGLGLALGAVEAGERFTTIVHDVVLHGAAVVAVVWGGILLCRRRLPRLRSMGQTRMLREVLEGFTSLDRRTALTSGMLTFVVWGCECLALWCVFQAFGTSLEMGQLTLLLGVSTLSTLVPTAPGYVGSYQLVFVLAMAAFGIAETVGLVVATAIQLCLFGSVTLVALGVYAMRATLQAREHLRVRAVPGPEKASHG